MLHKINSLLDAKAVLAFGVIASVVGFGAVNAHAQAETTLNLQINAGALTLYAGDNTNNDDLCTPADDGQAVELVTCSATERSATLSAIAVKSTRQNTNTTIDDILFEDLTGVATNTYSIAATACDLKDGSKEIKLGANPDAVTSDTDADAPTAGDAGKIFATLNPSAAGSAVTVLRPASAVTQFSGNSGLYSKGSKTTVVNTTTPITVFSTTAPVIPARANIDGVTLKHRIPAFPEFGNYSCQMTFTFA